MNLEKLATLLRAGQIYAHHCHNNADGATFQQDHEFFGEEYSAMESAYDSVVERMIGTGKPVDTISLAQKAVALAGKMDRECGQMNRNYYSDLLKIEEAICNCVDAQARGERSQGVLQLIGGIADDSQVRQYKIRQRLK